MPATTSTATKAPTTNANKEVSQAIKPEALNSEAFQTARLIVIESPQKETRIELQDESTESISNTKQENTLPEQTPLQKMVQAAEQWKNCSKPHRI